MRKKEVISFLASDPVDMYHKKTNKLQNNNAQTLPSALSLLALIYLLTVSTFPMLNEGMT